MPPRESLTTRAGTFAAGKFNSLPLWVFALFDLNGDGTVSVKHILAGRIDVWAVHFVVPRVVDHVACLQHCVCSVAGRSRIESSCALRCLTMMETASLTNPKWSTL